MGLLRAFLAAELPAPLQDAIQTATSDLRKALGNDLIRWVPASNVHLTFKFLGDVSPSSLDLIKQMLEAEAAQCRTFDIRVEGIGSYPNPRRPRVLWVGLEGPASMITLQHAIEASAARLGYEPEERSYSPHLTIGRVRQNVSNADLHKIGSALEETSIGLLGTTRVDAIHLYQSELNPAGSIYTKLFSAHLQQN
jgi:2'-5' RNA ligase